MYGEAGSRFIHSPDVIDYAYQLVKEYDEHQRKEDRKFYKNNPNLKSKSKLKKERNDDK